MHLLYPVLSSLAQLSRLHKDAMLLQVIGGVSGQHQSKADGHRLMLGNMCLLANTAAMAVYFITAKQLVLKYPPMCVAAWAYVTAAVCMGCSAAAVVDRNHWQMPSIMWGPLAYWIVVCSVVGYYVVTWATQYLPASQVCLVVLPEHFVIIHACITYQLPSHGSVLLAVHLSAPRNALDTQERSLWSHQSAKSAAEGCSDASCVPLAS